MLDIRTVTPPGIALVLAFALVYGGLSMNRPDMVIAGWIFLGVAVFLQIAYLMLRNWKPRSRPEKQSGLVRRGLFHLLVADASEVPSIRNVLDDEPVERIDD